MMDDNLDVVGSSISQSPVLELSDQGALIRGLPEPASGLPLTHQTGQAVTDVSDIWATSNHADFMESI